MSADLHELGRRWVEDGTSLSILAAENGVSYSTLYGQLRALGYTLAGASIARPGRGINTDDDRINRRRRLAALAWAECRWADALAGRRFLDARGADKDRFGTVPRALTIIESGTCLADLRG